MIKPQDVVVLAKILSQKKGSKWTQPKIAVELCMSTSEINAAIQRLIAANLLLPYGRGERPQPIREACKEFLTYGFRYIFSARTGSLTRGVPTSYGADILKKELDIGNDMVPVWPHAEGTVRGFELKPLYRSVPDSVIQYPDEKFYHYLVLLDAIRSGRARERKIAIEKIKLMLKE